MALTMKELQEMEVGDFIVHVDFGIGKFGGLVRVPTGNSYQEMIRIVYTNNDKVDVSIHSLYKSANIAAAIPVLRLACLHWVQVPGINSRIKLRSESRTLRAT